MSTTKTVVKAVSTRRVEPQDGKRKDIIDLLKVTDRNQYKAAILISEIYESEEYKEWGYESFGEYVKTELDFYGYRKALVLQGMGEAFRKFSVDENLVDGMGYVKVAEVCNALNVMGESVTKSEVKDIFKRAKDMTTDEVYEFAKSLKMGESRGATTSRREVLTFKLLDEQADVVNEALRDAKDKISTDGFEANDGQALEFMAMIYMQKSMDGEVNTLAESYADEKVSTGENAEEKKTPRKTPAHKGKKQPKAEAAPAKKAKKKAA